MKPTHDTSHRRKVLGWWLTICLSLYVFSIGPVAWATNDAFHPAYLPDEVHWIYLPLAPFTRVEWIGNAFYWWTVVVWEGFPSGYTTL
jgi:hypothetical protein